ncbi:MAG TPA: DNA polymerase IV [bacterium]|nr:DNA polymerase IV [bacterium]HPJ72357.1 DNA polymerase IV [bacterium]HPQ66278.1 DNA polymerase IV [bacterium]
MRKIIHIDMDAFFAAIEQRDDPRLRGKPVAVGSPRGRSVVCTASYEARRYGVHSALPSSAARRRCPSLIFVPPRFEAYREVSEAIRAIFAAYTDLVEPLSLDEAFLDVTANLKGIPSATAIAREIKLRIRAETGLTGSAGISVNKFLAKVASDLRKPDGLTVIRPEAVESFVAALPPAKIPGIGPATLKKLRGLGVRTTGDIRLFPVEELCKRLGSFGPTLHELAFGIDGRPVVPARPPKSMGAETTFPRDLARLGEMAAELEKLAGRVGERLRSRGRRGRTVTVKIRTADFRTTTRSRTLSRPVQGGEEIAAAVRELLLSPPPADPVRLLGVCVSSLDPLPGEGGSLQLTLSF